MDFTPSAPPLPENEVPSIQPPPYVHTPPPVKSAPNFFPPQVPAPQFATAGAYCAPSPYSNYMPVCQPVVQQPSTVFISVAPQPPALYVRPQAPLSPNNCCVICTRIFVFLHLYDVRRSQGVKYARAGLSVWALICCCGCPFGFAALIMAMVAQSRWASGIASSEQSAQSLNNKALVIALVGLTIGLLSILYFAVRLKIPTL